MLRILRVLAPNPGVYTLEGTNTWVVGSDPAAIIDPGPDDPSHLGELARAAGPVGVVLVTHDHPDHSPGAATFAADSGAPLMAWRLDGAERLRDRQVVKVGSLEIHAIHTPGHTADHVSFHIPEVGALFTGDAVLGRGTSFIDPPGGDLAKYLRSLERMLELGARTIYPGHGPAVLDPSAKLHEYISHRAEREEQVLAALSDGPRSIDAMVGSIYADYPRDVFPLAARSVLAHLIKLEHEGRVTKKGRDERATYERATPKT